MKKYRMLLVCILCAALLAGCGAGDTSDARREIQSTGDYSKSEVRHAMSLVEQYFSWNFEGCTLLELRYDGDTAGAEEAQWAENYGREVIVLESAFRTDDRGGDGSLNPNSTYENYSWILTKNAFGLWDLENWGYG